MSIIVDKQFINIASGNLRNFKWKKDSLANCSCPICGDSKKDKKKARGYFYSKHGRFFYKCHNCDYWCNLHTFFKETNPSLYKEYCLQLWSGGTLGAAVERVKKKKGEEVFKMKSPKGKFGKKPSGCTCIKDLPSDHPAVQFVNLRMIPKEHWGLLYFTEKFGNLAATMDPDQKLLKYDPRLVIPFYNKSGEVVAVQGRSLSMKDEQNARNTVKYITVKADKSIDRLWYGMWRANPKKRVYAVEGPLDSLFIPNTVAMVGAGAVQNIPDRLKNSDMVFVLDNEPRNKQIVKYNEQLIAAGRKVCIWSSTNKHKDINDMIFERSSRDIRKEIDKNTYSGLEATVRLNQWRRV